MANEQNTITDSLVGVASQYVHTLGGAQPEVQMVMSGCVVLIVLIVAVAHIWHRKITVTGSVAGTEAHAPIEAGVPLEAFTHMVEEQSRQTESLRNAVDDLREVVRGFGHLLAERTICPFDHPRCATFIETDGSRDA